MEVEAAAQEGVGGGERPRDAAEHDADAATQSVRRRHSYPPHAHPAAKGPRMATGGPKAGGPHGLAGTFGRRQREGGGVHRRGKQVAPAEDVWETGCRRRPPAQMLLFAWFPRGGWEIAVFAPVGGIDFAAKSRIRHRCSFPVLWPHLTGAPAAW